MKIGSVTELGPGRFWARGPRPDRTSLGVHPTRERADAVRAAAADELSRADRTRGPGVTLRDFGARVLGERARDLPRSAAADRTRWKRVEGAPFADDALATLTPPVVDRWARQLLHDLPGSALVVLSLLRTVCGQAVREGLLVANPCASIRLRRPPRHHEPWTYLLPAEQQALLVAPIPELDALQIGALLGTGIRDGELFSLRLADVHLEGDPHLVIRYGSPFGPPKGKKIRRVPLFGLGLRSVRRWLELLPAYCPDNPRGLAFPGPRGGFQDAGCFLVRQTHHEGRRATLNDFQEALAAAGVVTAARHDGRPVRAHDLRHTFAASLVCGWWGDPWRLEDLCAVMGHSSITITQRYAHLDEGRVLELVRRSPGLLLGDAPVRPRALHAAKAARIAPAAGAADGTGCSPTTGKYHGVRADSTSGNPPITREQAIEGLRALAGGDLDAARAQLDGRALVAIFEAALDVRGLDVAVGDPGPRGRR